MTDRQTRPVIAVQARDIRPGDFLAVAECLVIRNIPKGGFRLLTIETQDSIERGTYHLPDSWVAIIEPEGDTEGTR